MKSYGQFCPIAIACETFAERWTPLILRELVLAGARRFNEIRQTIPRISRSMLARRLRELEDAGVVQSQPLARGRGREYWPTGAGEEFRDILLQLGAWGQRWSTKQFDLKNLDLMMLMWNVRRRVNHQRLPGRRVVVRFEFHGFPVHCRTFRTCWLVLARDGTDLCLKDPGYEVDVVVSANAATMARVWMGAMTFAQAVGSGGLRVQGPRELVRAFPTWLLLSGFARVERPARAG